MAFAGTELAPKMKRAATRDAALKTIRALSWSLSQRLRRFKSF